MREYDHTIVGSKEDYNDMMANKENIYIKIWVILTTARANYWIGWKNSWRIYSNLL
jgi:hypothetical protein